MKSTEKKVPYHKKPGEMAIDEWQILLRKQYGIKQDFEVCNSGDHPVFSDYTVYNDETQATYKVAVRSLQRNEGNFCSCPDFTINQLGTCKHIEYVLYKIQTDESKQESLKDSVQEKVSSLSIRYEKTRRLFLTMAGHVKDEMRDAASGYFDSEGYCYPGKLNDVRSFIKKARAIEPDFCVYPDTAEYIATLESVKKRVEHVNKLFSKGVKSRCFDDLIRAGLYSYQKEGVIFCAKAGRALLADEMGLGKTVQTIATAELFIKEFDVQKILIVCPTSLKYQWYNEIKKFTGKEAHIVTGPIHAREKQYQLKHHYCIVSYGVIGNDLDYINHAHFDMVIIDEAQRIKNWSTKTAKNVKKIKTEYAIVLTGTPLENKIEELHSIVEFIDRYKLGVLFRFLYKHQIYDDSGKVIGYTRLKEIQDSLYDILLRRTKKEIKNQLRGRIDKTYYVDMTAEQQNYHNSYYDAVARLVSLWKKKGVLSAEERQNLLINLNCMRMCCDSTYILNQDARHDTKIDELMKILEDIFSDETCKVVIFSQWARMHQLVKIELKKRDIGYVYLHGSVPAHKRDALIKEFHNEPSCRVFLSTDAGGVGLNLQCARFIINLDIPWNPAVLEQRIGRVYRLGQKDVVQVINMVSEGTIEHRILYLLEFKKSVFKGVLEDGEDTVIMKEDGIKSFMESIESLVHKQSQDGIYITPHAENNDEEHDYEIQPVDKKKQFSSKAELKEHKKSVRAIRKRISSFINGFKKLFHRK